MNRKADTPQKNSARAVAKRADRAGNDSVQSLSFVDNQAQTEIQPKAAQRDFKGAAAETRPIQRVIDGIASWSDFQSKYFDELKDTAPDMFKAYVETLIAEERPYTFTQARERAYDLASGEAEAYEVCEIKLSTLIPLLDPIQHRPDLVSYKEGDKKIEQASISEEGASKHYKDSNLQDIADVQNSESLDETQIKPIFFGVVKSDAESLVRTSDGRHRIAVYNAMGIEWIKAELLPSQRAILEGRQVEIRS